MRIQIIGYSGAGKSTLAEKLAKYYGVAHLYMDSSKFYGHMQVRDEKEQIKIVEDFLDKNENWVIDGNYYDVVNKRYEMMDEIYFLDFGRFFCLKSAMKRLIKNKGKKRESLGAVEKFNFSFIWWILYEGRTKYWRNKHLEHFNMVKNHHHFKSRKELIAYLKENGIDC